MKKSEAVLLSALTGHLLTKDFDDVHKFCERELGRPILSHEFASLELWMEIKLSINQKVIDLIESEVDDLTDDPSIEGKSEEVLQ